MRGTQSEETLRSKEPHERSLETHWDRVYAYRVYRGMFYEPLLKESVQTCGQQIRYCGLGSHHKNKIVECRIKELTLGS